jgi:hypothetical protein
MQTLDMRLRIPEHVVARKVGDETVILNLDSGTYFGLDSIGGRFFELVEEESGLRTVVERMLAEYEVTGTQLESDLLRLTEDLKASGLLETA